MKNAYLMMTGALVLAACAAPTVGEEKGDVASRQVSSSSGSSGSSGYRRSGTIRAYGMGANVRAAASTQSAIVGGLTDGTTVSVTCQTKGESVDGNTAWDFVAEAGGYVSDALIETSGDDGVLMLAPRCDADAPSSSSSGSAPSSAPGSLASRLIAEARKHTGYRSTGTCNKFSPPSSGVSCQAWCADFLNVVWRTGGADTTGLNGGVISFYEQAVRNGTWKPGRYARDVRPGDAVIWATGPSDGRHIAMVTEVLGSELRVIHGNFSDSVYEGTISRDADLQTGSLIYGFASPVE